jgi:hypothetical protein
MTGQVGNLYCYVKDRIKLGTFAFVRLFVKLGLDKACPQLDGSVPDVLPSTVLRKSLEPLRLKFG